MVSWASSTSRALISPLLFSPPISSRLPRSRARLHGGLKARSVFKWCLSVPSVSIREDPSSSVCNVARCSSLLICSRTPSSVESRTSSECSDRATKGEVGDSARRRVRDSNYDVNSHQERPFTCQVIQSKVLMALLLRMLWQVSQGLVSMQSTYSMSSEMSRVA